MSTAITATPRESEPGQPRQSTATAAQPQDATAAVLGLSPQPDSQLGVFLDVPVATRRAALATAGVRFIDLIGGPDLEQFDASLASPGLHMTVRDCPKLRVLLLPAEGAGAHLHIDFGWREPELTVRGALADLDAAWFEEAPYPGLRPCATSLPRARGERPARHHLWLGSRDTPWGDSELVVLVEPKAAQSGVDDPTLTVAAGSACRELVLQQLRGVQAVVVEGRLDALELRDCREVAQIDTGDGVTRLRAERCPSLAVVTGSGGTVGLTAQTGAETLELGGVWALARLTESTTAAVMAPLVSEMEVLACPHLRRLQMLAGSVLRCAGVPWLQHIEGPSRLDLDPNGAFDGLREAAQTDPQVRAALLASAATARTPRQALRAIQVLAELARAGEHAAQIWRARDALYARVVQYQLRSWWAWQFPDDLGDRGWMADVRLWLRCRSQAASAVEFEMALRQAHDPEHLAAVARTVVVASDPQQRQLLASVLGAQLAHGAAHGTPLNAGRPDRHVADGLEARVEQRLQAVLRAVRTLQAEGLGNGLPGQFCLWLVRRMPCEEGLYLLAALRDLGCDEAVPALATVAASPTVEPAMRRLATALLMGGASEPD